MDSVKQNSWFGDEDQLTEKVKETNDKSISSQIELGNLTSVSSLGESLFNTNLKAVNVPVKERQKSKKF